MSDDQIKNDHLWDPAADPAPGESDVQHLERLLSRFRGRADESTQFLESAFPQTSSRGAHPRAAWWPNTWRVQLAFAAVLLLIFGAGWLALNNTAPAANTWQVARLEGAPQVGAELVGENFRLRAGQTLETNSVSSARISVGEIGEVEVGPDSRVRLIAANRASGTLSMDQGTIHAFITAPARSFNVQTPAANAVDLGCQYTLHLGPDGNGYMRVTLGWVAFERNARESFIPVDAMCLIDNHKGPGTPFYENATQVFRDALEVLDFKAPPRFTFADAATDVGTRAKALAILCESARRRDAITLWHLLARTTGDERAKVFDRLSELVPPPTGVTRQGILAGDAHMRDLYWDALGLEDTGWWREWKRAFPTK